MSIVYLKHEDAAQFFEDAKHLNLEELKRRDKFFQEIESSMDIRFEENGDIVADIPDLDVSAMQ